MLDIPKFHISTLRITERPRLSARALLRAALLLRLAGAATQPPLSTEYQAQQSDSSHVRTGFPVGAWP
jgi:hypothetical protein